MYYVPDLLCMSRRGKLSRCWLAGILSEQMFKTKVTNKKILSVDIVVACEEILKVFNRNSEDHTARFSLYLSARLMCGIVRLYKYQLTLFEKSLSIALHNLQPISLEVAKKRQKRTRIDLHLHFTDDLIIPDAPSPDFGNLSFRQDVNQLQEPSPETLRRNREMLEASIPNFGRLTDEQVDEWLSTKEWGTGQDDSEHRPGLPPPPIEDHFVHPADVVPIRMDLPTGLERTPKKRPSSSSTEDRPTKRRKKLETDIEPVADRRTEELPAVLPPIDEELDQPISAAPPPDREEDVAIPLPIDLLGPSVQQEADSTIPADNNAPLQTGKKGKIKSGSRRIDKNRTISEKVKKRNVANVEAHTVPLSTTIAVPAQRRGVSLSSMLQHPSKTFKFGTERIPNIRQRMFSVELMARFETATSGPFVTTTDYSAILDYIRKKNTTIEQMPSALVNKTGPEVSNKDNTVHEAVDSDVPGLVDDAQAETMNEPELEAVSEAPLPLADVTDEQTSTNTSKAKAARHEKQPESIIQPENGEAIESPKEFDADSQDLDAFLPQLLRKKDKVTKTSHEKTRPEAIVEISSLQSSTRSEVTESMWINKRDLEATLEIEWRDCPVLPFKKLNPPGETRRVDAAFCVSLLLELRKEKKVNLKQTDQIYITKASSSDNEDEIDA